MSKIEFRRDKETGELLVYKDGEYAGEIVTMGDVLEREAEGKEDGRQSKMGV